MFRFKSITSRILFLHVVAVVVTAILMPLVLYWFLNRDVENLQRHTMREQAESLARHLALRPDGDWSLDLPARLRDQYSEAYGRYAYAVLDDAGRVLFSSRKDSVPIFSIENHSTEAAFPETRRGNRIISGNSLHKISGISLRKDQGGRTVFIQVAEDLAHRDVLIDDVVANFFPQVAWITLPILLLLLAIDSLIFRRAMQPLLRASDRARHINPTQIDVRLPIEDIPREILPLVTAVNQAFDRLEQGFRRQREFTADAAHELRTPLAVLRARIETLPDKDAVKALHLDIEDMSRVVGQLLDAAELETLVIDPDDRADLHEVCADLVGFIAPLALAQQRTVALTGAEGAVWIKGNAEMLRRAIRNLVENALKHAPIETEVEIVVGEQGTVSVLDEGEGVANIDRDLIFQRFWRRDRQNSGGAGLGLSIVKRIVEAHCGTVRAENRLTGGANFSMRFPLAEQPQKPPLEAPEERLIS
ncbi:MAG: ATP-binding protein [Afipia sp.]|nr:ATP-binding protein [Afipia sp.]